MKISIWSHFTDVEPGLLRTLPLRLTCLLLPSWSPSIQAMGGGTISHYFRDRETEVHRKKNTFFDGGTVGNPLFLNGLSFPGPLTPSQPQMRLNDITAGRTLKCPEAMSPVLPREDEEPCPGFPVISWGEVLRILEATGSSRDRRITGLPTSFGGRFLCPACGPF